MVFPSPKSNTCYAFVNYISQDSVQKVLKTREPIVFKGHCLQIRIQSSKNYAESSVSDESSSVSNKASKSVVNQIGEGNNNEYINQLRKR